RGASAGVQILRAARSPALQAEICAESEQAKNTFFDIRANLARIALVDPDNGAAALFVDG
ncbi:hypothetical protein, partial [Bradyrhizobium sp.]|uniref:hypothetical protein n=1 Tax=Bradyrhizobium sp. TaxID=376 RepID=UPI003C272BD9